MMHRNEIEHRLRKITKEPLVISAVDAQDQLLHREEFEGELRFLAYIIEQILLRCPLTAEIAVTGENNQTTIDHVPVTSEDIRKHAAYYFVNRIAYRSYREGDTWVSANAAGTWYKILLELPAPERFIGDDMYYIIAEHKSSLRIHAIYEKHRTETVRQRIKDILKETGSSTRIIKENGIWLVAKEGLYRREWESFDYKGLEINVHYSGMRSDLSWIKSLNKQTAPFTTNFPDPQVGTG